MAVKEQTKRDKMRRKQFDRDAMWAYRNAEIIERYAGQIVAISHRKIWGQGLTQEAALEVARKEPNCPAFEDLLFVFIPEATSTIHFPLLTKAESPSNNPSVS